MYAMCNYNSTTTVKHQHNRYNADLVSRFFCSKGFSAAYWWKILANNFNLKKCSKLLKFKKLNWNLVTASFSNIYKIIANTPLKYTAMATE